MSDSLREELSVQKKDLQRTLRQVVESNLMVEWYQNEAAAKSEGLNRVEKMLRSVRCELVYEKWLSKRATERRDQAEQRSKEAEKERTVAQRLLEQMTSEKRGDVLHASAQAAINQLKVRAMDTRLEQSMQQNVALRLQYESVLLAQNQAEVLRDCARATIYQLNVSSAEGLLAESWQKNEALRAHYEAVLLAQDDKVQRAMAELERNDHRASEEEHDLRQQINRLQNAHDMEVESATAARTQQAMTDVLSATSRKKRKQERSKVAAKAGRGSLQPVLPIWHMKPSGKVER